MKTEDDIKYYLRRLRKELRATSNELNEAHLHDQNWFVYQRDKLDAYDEAIQILEWVLELDSRKTTRGLKHYAFPELDPNKRTYLP